MDIGELDEGLIAASGYVSVPAIRHQFERLLGSNRVQADQVVICLPPSYLHYRCIPWVDEAQGDTLQELIDLEILHLAPLKSAADFSTSFLPLSSPADSSPQMLALFSDYHLELAVREALHSLEMGQCIFRSPVLSAHSSYHYNYPEKHDQIVALCFVDEHELCLSLHQAENLLYFMACPLRSVEDAVEELCSVVENVLQERTERIDTLGVYGDYVRPSLLRNLRAGLDERVHEVERLNAFRMCQSSMDEAHRHFAARYAHRFALCVGNSMPLKTGPIELFLQGHRNLVHH